MGHPTSPRSGIHTWFLLPIPSHSSMVPWDPIKHPTNPWSELGLGLGARSGTAGISLGIPRHHGNNRTGWTKGTKHIPDLGLVGCPMGSQGTMENWTSQDILRQSRTTLKIAGKWHQNIYAQFESSFLCQRFDKL